MADADPNKQEFTNQSESVIERGPLLIDPNTQPDPEAIQRAPLILTDEPPDPNAIKKMGSESVAEDGSVTLPAPTNPNAPTAPQTEPAPAYTGANSEEVKTQLLNNSAPAAPGVSLPGQGNPLEEFSDTKKTSQALQSDAKNDVKSIPGPLGQVGGMAMDAAPDAGNTLATAQQSAQAAHVPVNMAGAMLGAIAETLKHLNPEILKQVSQLGGQIAGADLNKGKEMAANSTGFGGADLSNLAPAQIAGKVTEALGMGGHA